MPFPSATPAIERSLPASPGLANLSRPADGEAAGKAAQGDCISPLAYSVTIAAPFKNSHLPIRGAKFTPTQVAVQTPRFNERGSKPIPVAGGAM